MKISTLICILFFASSVFAKRAAPPGLAPLSKGEIVYKVVGDEIPCEKTPASAENKACGYRRSIAAFAKDKQLWKTELYRRMYNVSLEQDVQVIEPRSWKLIRGDREIELYDEHGAKYVLESKSGKRLAPRLPIEYPPQIL